MRGKKGPYPVETKEPTADPAVEIEEQPIKTNGEAPIEPAESTAGRPPMMEFVCPDCEFKTDHDIEASEHAIGTEHGAAKLVEKKPEQAQLFSDPEFVVRILERRISEKRLAELHQELGEICSNSLLQEEEIEAAKDRVKALKTEMQGVRAKIRYPFETGEVQCRWEISVESNSKKLFRLDTNELVSEVALSAEDRARELLRVDQANAVDALSEPTTEPVAETVTV